VTVKSTSTLRRGRNARVSDGRASTWHCCGI
jgi:hypothetical protein